MNRETGLCTGTLDGDNTIASFDFLAKLFTDGYADATCDYEDSFQKGENALALYGHSKYQDYKAALGDDLILVPLPDMGHGVYTCSGSTVMIMTTGAQESGKDDAVWAMLQEATNPDYIKMVVDVNGAVPARSVLWMQSPTIVRYPVSVQTAAGEWYFLPASVHPCTYDHL